MDKKTVSKLRLALWNGYEIPAACTYAGIAQEDYEKAITLDKNLKRRMDRAQMYPQMKAKVELAHRIASGDGRLAMKYLEAREPEHYDLGYIRKFGRVED